MHVLLRGSLLQHLRLASGLVLLVFAATHFFNHALGLFGLAVMASFQDWRLVVTHSWPGTLLLYGALATHIVLALHRLATRKSWRMPLWEAAQALSGLVIPLLLFEHIVETRIAGSFFGVFTDYTYALSRLWPGRGLAQSVLLLLVWLHGCLGLHHWLRLSARYRQLAPALLVLALMLPVAALAGFIVSGRIVAEQLADPARLASLGAAGNWPDTAVASSLALLTDATRMGLLLFLAGCLALLWLNRIRRATGPRIALSYAAGPTIATPPGMTILEVSRQFGIPHAAVCGGRARCSTCRVRIEPQAGPLPPPGPAEARTLAAIRAPADVRLACQVRALEPMRVTRLLRAASASPRHATTTEAESEGVERTLAVMFLDLRGFTALTEKRLPYDVVFLLNRFFDAIGEAILSEQGWIDKYMGDGLLAVFGRDTDVATACRQALNAARRIDWALDQVNQDLRAEFGRPLDVAMGLHVGTLVVGRIGHAGSAAVTVIGPVVNAASRLEGLTKEKKVQLVVSRALSRAAGWSAEGLPVENVTVRGFTEPIEVLLVERARLIYLDPPARSDRPA